jgi:hypothetical protein
MPGKKGKVSADTTEVKEANGAAQLSSKRALTVSAWDGKVHTHSHHGRGAWLTRVVGGAQIDEQRTRSNYAKLCTAMLARLPSETVVVYVRAHRPV